MDAPKTIDDSGSTRFEVFDHRKPGGVRLLVAYCKVSLSVEDDGRTLKVFLTNADSKVR